MPTRLTITRGASKTTMKRADVPTFAVFTVPDRDGRARKEYANIGVNGRAYAVNLETRELASSENRDKKVQLTGKWEFVSTKLPTHRTIRMTRDQVRPGDIFVVEGKDTEYAAIGSVNKDRHGWLSIPMSRPQNHAIAENGDSRVTVVGSFTMNVTSTK